MNDLLDKIKLQTEMWLGISATFPLPMLILRNSPETPESVVVQAFGPVDQLLGCSISDLVGKTKSQIILREKIANEQDCKPTDKGSVIFRHTKIGERVAPAAIMHFSYDDISYEVIMVLAGVRAIEDSLGSVVSTDSDIHVGL